MSSLTADLEEAARIGAGADGGISRFAWTPELARANEWFVRRIEELGLAAEVDAAGNVIGRWDAGEGPAVLAGSHLDTVPQGGRFDGALGVLPRSKPCALKREGLEPRRPLWLVSFNDEEGARFRTGMLGSRAFVGEVDTEDWRRRGVADAMAEAGFDFDRLGEARVEPCRRLPRAAHRAGTRARARGRRRRDRHGDRGLARVSRAFWARRITPARRRWGCAAMPWRGCASRARPSRRSSSGTT